MVNEGAEMPILNGMRSSARTPGAASRAAITRAGRAPVRRVISIVSSSVVCSAAETMASFGRGRRGRLVVDQRPDLVLQRVKARLALEPQCTRTFDVDRDVRLDASRPA